MKKWWMVAGLLAASPAWTQTGANLLLVVNRNSPDSKAIADYYAKRRAVPARNFCTIDATVTETIDRLTYDARIAGPISECLTKNRLTESILYIVTTLGVPLRIDGNGGRNADLASVDSELALLYYKMKGNQVSLPGPMRNPFFQAVNEPFDHSKFPIYLVTRLAAYDREGVFRLIDQSLYARNRGKIVIDMLDHDSTPGNGWLAEAARQLPADRVVLDTTSKVVYDRTEVIAYASWGSNDPARKKRFLNYRWLPGAIMTEYVSTNGRTFVRPPATWELGNSWTDTKQHYANSPQSLLGDYLQEGVTGAAGHVYEPYLTFCPRPDILLPAYLSGKRNLAEAYYLSIPALSWQNVVIGDPLCKLQP